jgi:putative transposase
VTSSHGTAGTGTGTDGGVDMVAAADGSAAGAGEGSARFCFRLRVSATAEPLLLKEWDRCRWVWNMCVETSKAAHKAREKCGPARLDKMLTAWRSGHAWLAAGASVPQQQIIRDFGKSRAKALKDIREKVPMRRRAGMPHFKSRRLAGPTLNYTLRGFRIRDGRLHLAGSIVLTVVWSRDLPARRPASGSTGTALATGTRPLSCPRRSSRSPTPAG